MARSSIFRLPDTKLCGVNPGFAHRGVILILRILRVHPRLSTSDIQDEGRPMTLRMPLGTGVSVNVIDHLRATFFVILRDFLCAVKECPRTASRLIHVETK
jgi:hypothetical protein